MKVNDLTTYPVPAPPVTPPAGRTFTDPTFGTTILRVTDENTAAGQNVTNDYSGIFDMFNVDSSRFMFSLGIAQLDVANRKASNFQAVSKPGGVYYWSRINPNVFYAVETWAAARIWRYDCLAGVWSLIVDLSTLLPVLATAGPNASWVGSRGMSWDDNRFQINAGGIGLFAYDVALGKLIGPFTLAQAMTTGWMTDPTQASFAFYKSTMDATGKVMYTADYNLVFNIETGASFLPGFNVPANQYNDVHTDFGHGNVLAGTGGNPLATPPINDGFYPFIATVDPSNLKSYLSPRKILGPRFLWGIGIHTAFRDAAGKWPTYSIDDTPPIGIDAGRVATFGPEIVQFGVNSPPDGSINQRIAHHHTNPSIFPDAATQYWAIAKASNSQDNRCVGWNSTYGNKRIDVYIAFIDQPKPPVGAEITSELAGVQFSQDEAKLLKVFAQSQLSLKKG